jgi:hypothetical protein
MVRAFLIIAFWTLAAYAASANDRQSTCNQPTTNDWLNGNLQSDWTGWTDVDASLVQQVSKDLSPAIALLATEGAVPLTAEEVRRFTGDSAHLGGSGATPYLIRAVYPTANPSISVGWYGNDLYVFAGGLGCAPYEEHPIIAYLDRSPARVFVSASAAL